MQYKEIQANNGTIAIGYIGDNLATKVLFDTTEIIQTYGAGGSFELLVKQQTNKHCYPNVYPANIEIEAGNVVWYPTSQDTSSGQYMDVELVYTIGQQIVYSKMFRCVCKKSLANNDRGNAPEQSWVTKVLAAAADIKISAQAASEDASTALSAAETASGAATSASAAAGSAAQAAATAEQAAQAAQTAADSVTTATVAETKSYLGI